MQTDASERGLGAALSQTDHQRRDYRIAYASRKLLLREMRYSVIEKECLAIVWALEFIRVYLYSQSFVIQADHQPQAWLQWMMVLNKCVLGHTILLPKCDLYI